MKFDLKDIEIQSFSTKLNDHESEKIIGGSIPIPDPEPSALHCNTDYCDSMVRECQNGNH